MRVFWNDRGRGLSSAAAKEADLETAISIWFEEVRAASGNFLGLTDARGNTIQFYFDAGIPDDVDDASHLRIVRLDFPRPELRGSYGATVSLSEVSGLMAKAFHVGSDHTHFSCVSFEPW